MALEYGSIRQFQLEQLFPEVVDELVRLRKSNQKLAGQAIADQATIKYMRNEIALKDKEIRNLKCNSSPINTPRPLLSSGPRYIRFPERRSHATPEELLRRVWANASECVTESAEELWQVQAIFDRPNMFPNQKILGRASGFNRAGCGDTEMAWHF